MFSKTKSRIMSAFIATSMAMTPLLGYADLVRGDGGTVDNIWAVAGAEGPDISTLTISDDQPGEGYILFGKYIDDYVNYEITSEDEGLMILANNSSLDTPPGLNVDYRLSGECYVTVTGLMVAYTDDRFPEYEGDKSVPSLLEFYTSDIYEDDEENGHWAERLNIEVFGEMDITDWFAANDLIIDEGAVFNIGYYDVENDEWHDGHVTAGNVIIGGEVYIGDRNKDGIESELIVFDDLSVFSGGQLLAACNARLVFDDMATCSIDGFPFKVNDGNGGFEDFEFEDGHGRYEFVSRPVDVQDPDTGIFWEYTEPEPERPEHTYCVDYDDRGGEASVTVGEGEPDAIIRRPWDPYEFETGTAVVFKLNPPQGYNLSTAIVEIVEFAEDEDVNYSSELDPSDPHYIEINREDGTFAFTTSCYGYDVFISWSAYEFRFDRDSHFVVETHANDKGSVVFVDDSACERIEEDPYCPGNFRYLFNYDVFDEGNTLQIKFVPNANCVLQDIGINLNGTETFYARENRPDHPTILFEDAQNLTDNGDGTYTWTISASSDWNEWYNVNTYFEKVINVSGIELEARDATKIEYSLDGGAYTTLESSMIGEGDGAHEGYYVSPETLDGHDSITFRFTYDNGVIKKGVRVEYAQNSNRKIDILPFDNDSNPYEFTLNKTGTAWNDYGIQVNDWPTPFNGTYLVTRHGPGDVVVTGVDMDVLSDYEDGDTLTFTVTCNEGVYKVVGRYSNDPNNAEFDIPCNEGTYSIQPNGGGLDIMIYTTEDEYNIDHLNANYGDGEADFEIFVNEHGFNENGAPFDGDFTHVEDTAHIKAFASSGNRTRYVVKFTNTEIQQGKAKITLNLIPKYDCIYDVYLGDTKLDIVNGQVEIDLSNVIEGERLPIYIDVTYESPETIEVKGATDEQFITFSTDGETYFGVDENNIVDIKKLGDIDSIYLKVNNSDENFVVSGIEVMSADGNTVLNTLTLTDGVGVLEKNGEWQAVSVRIAGQYIAGTYTIKYAREEDSSSLTFADGYHVNDPITYYVGDRISIQTKSGTVAKAVATGAENPIELTRNGDVFYFDPPVNGDYDITFYISEEEYNFETLEGEKFVIINVDGLTDEAGTITCTGSTGFATYNGVMKFACHSDEAEIVISVNQGYFYSVFNGSSENITESVKNNNNTLTLAAGAGSGPTVKFEAMPALIAGSSDKTFTNNPGTEIKMTADIQDTGAVVVSREWFQSADGESYTKIEGANGESYIATPTATTYYKCVVTDTYGNTLDIIFTANVTLIPIVDETPDANKSKTILIGESATLTAVVSGGHNATIAWSESTDGENYTAIDGETTNEITVTPETNTSYRCTVSDPYNEPVVITFTVTVTLPVISDTRTDSEKQTEVTYGSEVTLDAKTDASGPKYTWESSEDGIDFTPITGATGKTFGFTPQSDAVYRCTVTDMYGTSLVLDFDITVNFVLTDNTSADSKTVSIIKTESAELTVDATENTTTGVTYTWTYSVNGVDFIALNDASGKTVTVSPVVGTEYRCDVADGHNNSFYVLFTVSVTTPELNDAREDSEKTFNLTCGSGDITLDAKTNATDDYEAQYVWQKSTDNGQNFEDIGVITKIFNFTPVESAIYRCVVTDKYGNSINLDFTVTVSFVLTDNTAAEAKSVTITKTDSATLTVDVTEDSTTGVTYAWSFSTDGENYEPIQGETTKTINVTPLVNTFYKYEVADEHGNTVEGIFTVTVETPELNDTRDASNLAVDYTYGSGDITLDAKTNGTADYNLVYGWFKSTDNGQTFEPIQNEVSETYTFTPDGSAIYQCAVFDKYSNILYLDFNVTFGYVLADNTDPDSLTQEISKGDSVTLTVDVTETSTTGVTYTWSSSTDGTNYEPMQGETTKSITVTPDSTTFYKCDVADDHGNTVTDEFQVTVTIPELKDTRSASEKTFTVTYGSGNVTFEAKTNATAVYNAEYIWQKSVDGGVTFTTVTGATSKTLTVTPDDSAIYYCIVSDKYGNHTTLNFTLTVNFVLTKGSNSTGVTITKFDSTTLEAKVSENTTTGITYTWCESSDGTTFTAMGKTTKFISVSPASTTTYKCDVKDGHGNSVSITYKVTVKVPQLKDLTPSTSKTKTVTKGDSVTLEVKVNDTETTGIKYKWYKSTNGTSFNVVADEKNSKITFTADSNVTYSCTVTDKYGNSVEVVFKVTVNEPSTPTPTPDPESESFGGFVERLYNVALGRDSEAEGKEFWVKNVEAGNLTGADAAREFLNSKEFKDKGLTDEQFLAVLYETFFNRDYKDDPDGFNFWMNSLKSVGRDKVVDGFINSTEWCNICAEYGIRSGATTAKATKASKNAIAFAERLYTCCLGREAEPEGLNFWSLSLTNLEVSGSEAARQFFTSAEFKGFNTSNEEYVKRLYTTFMGREYDEGGLNYWLGEMKNGMTREQVFDNFVSSKEFTDICNSYGISR